MVTLLEQAAPAEQAAEEAAGAAGSVTVVTVQIQQDMILKEQKEAAGKLNNKSFITKPDPAFILL